VLYAQSIACPLGLLAAFAASCSRDPQKLKLTYLANGDRLVANKDYASAIIEYGNAIKLDAKFGEARYKLAMAYQAVGDTAKEFREYIRAAELLPRNVEAQLRAGSILLFAERYTEAQACARAVLAQEPKNVKGLLLMGNALAGLKDLEGAILQFEEAIDTDPHMTLSYANLGIVRMAEGAQPKAEAAFKQATELEPTSIPAHLNLAGFYWASGRTSDAERELKEAFALDSHAPDTARAIATFYLSTGRHSEAEPYLQVYAATSTAAKLVLADYYVGEGRTKDAVSGLEALSKEKDAFVPAKLRLAAIDFQDKQRRPKAYQAIEEILKQEATNEPALEMKARFLARDERFQDALSITDAVIKKNPNALGTLYTRGISLESTGETAQALSTFQELHQKAPSSLPVQVELAKLYLVQGDAKTALDLLNEAIKANPKAGPPHFLLGQALLRTGHLDSAESELVRVAKSRPASAEAQTWLGLLYEAKHDLPRARAAYKRAFELQPKAPGVIAGMLSADLTEKKYDSVRAKLEAALAQNPKNVPLLLVAGNAYLTMGDLKKAEATYEALLQADPNNIAAFGKLGAIYHAQGRLDDATKKYEELVRREKKPVAALTLLGLISDLQNKPGDARTRYEEALSLDSKAAVAANNLAWAYAEKGENLDVALDLAQTAKAGLPESWEASDTLGWVYYKKGMTSSAITVLSEAARQAPLNPTAQYRLGLAYSKNGDSIKAKTAFERALKLNPEFKEAEDTKRLLASMKS
jgi:tetratricopeptide (TPR) repeat protein